MAGHDVHRHFKSRHRFVCQAVREIRLLQTSSNIGCIITTAKAARKRASKCEFVA